MKTGGRGENIDFWQILTTFAKFLLSEKRIMAFWWQNFLKSIYHKKHSILDNKKKWQNLGFEGKFLIKFALFDKWKDKWKPKASKLFWQDFIELANNSYSYALLKKYLTFEWQNLAKFRIFGKIFDEICIFWQRKNGIFGEKILTKMCWWRMQNYTEKY